MSKGAINFSRDNEYYTPKQIVKMFSDAFEYDPATTPEKAREYERLTRAKTVADIMKAYCPNGESVSYETLLNLYRKLMEKK